MTQPSTLSDALLCALASVTGLPGDSGPIPVPDDLCRRVADLSQLFTRERKSLTTSYLEDGPSRLAYLAYFLPVNLAKVQVLLDEMPVPTRQEGLTTKPFTVLDLGSGPGTAALGVLDWVLRSPTLSDRPLEVVAVDRSFQALEECKKLWNVYVAGERMEATRLATVRLDLERNRPQVDRTIKAVRPYDLIVLANVLNELFRTARDPVQKRAELVRDLLGLLDQNGTLMIIEPALWETSRHLHLVRNRLLEEKLCTVHSPCLHEKPCPALIKETDWCHEERPWTAPRLVAVIDRKVEFIKDALKFAYLLLRKDGKTVVERRPDVYRVVSELREMKGEKRAWLCNETGRPEVGRLDRARSETNEAFDDWHRGAIVRIGEIVRKDRKERESTIGRIPAEATVEIVRPV
jgi:ribosomal protein RSM22 (predicted rRNA methylase)